MPITPGNNLASSALPAYPALSTSLTVATARAGTQPIPILANASAMQVAQVIPNMNGNLAAQYLEVFFGSLPCILSGLALSATGTGLTLTVASGRANIGGYLEFPGGTLTLSDNQSNVWIYAQDNGTFHSVNGSASPPTGNLLLIGQATTSGGNITVLNYSGVVKMIGGVAWRTTADTAAPLDSPSAAWGVYTRTAYALYYWDTTAHTLVSTLAPGAIGTAQIAPGAVTAPKTSFAYLATLGAVGNALATNVSSTAATVSIPDPTAITTTTTLTGSMYRIFVDATAGNIVLTLPAASTKFAYKVFRVDSSGNTVTLMAGAGDNIFGASGFTIGTLEGYDVAADGVNTWGID
jgi:hypothetical protein